MSISSKYYSFKKRITRLLTGVTREHLIFAKRKRDYLRLNRTCIKAAKEIKHAKLNYCSCRARGNVSSNRCCKQE